MAGCTTFYHPVTEDTFAEGPVIIQRHEKYYLRYRVAEELQFRATTCVLMSEKDEKKGEAYFWFSCPISGIDWGSTVERPLMYDGFSEYAEKNSVFWINGDGTKIRIPVIKDPTEPIKINMWTERQKTNNIGTLR